MLYLAEIQKQNKGFMGGVDTKLKLIACRRNDSSWSTVNNESIEIDSSHDFGNGALVTVELDVNRKLQGKIEPASSKILTILKNFSRLLEKTQDQEQEIEQWRESLAIQSEELSRRQLEMETRLEQVEQMEQEFQQFEQQKQEIVAAKAEAEKIKAEFEAKSSELEGAWSQLRGQQQSLEEQLRQAQALDPTQANEIKQQLEAVKQGDRSIQFFAGQIRFNCSFGIESARNITASLGQSQPEFRANTNLSSRARKSNRSTIRETAAGSVFRRCDR